jgi:hypothetical protein
MKTLENTIQILTDAQCSITERSLVVGIPHPGDCAQGTYNDCDVGDNPNDEDHFAVDRMVSEVVHDLEYKPTGTGNGTSTVNASQMLQGHSVVSSHPRSLKVD